MGKLLSKLGGTKSHSASAVERFNMESVLGTLKKNTSSKETKCRSSTKRTVQKLQVENEKLKSTVQKQAQETAGLRSGTSIVYRRTSKSWSKYSRQQKNNIESKYCIEFL